MPATFDKSSVITLTIGSDAEQVSLLSEALHALCLYATESEKCALDVQSAVVEALNNIVIHSYQNQPGHEITVCWSKLHKQLRIDIIDNGDSINCLPIPELPDFEKEGGRGWWIINACVDEYFYQVVETVDHGRILRPGKHIENSSITLPKSHTNTLTFIKHF
jgi:anti-sigma regulatory factor (Ser/Thr protein kinase)